MEVVEQVKTKVERTDFIRSTLQTAKHVIVRWKVCGLKQDDPTVRFGAAEVGLNRATFVTAIVAGEHTSVVWDGDVKNIGLRFDGWPGESFEIICSIWGN